MAKIRLKTLITQLGKKVAEGQPIPSIIESCNEVITACDHLIKKYGNGEAGNNLESMQRHTRQMIASANRSSQVKPKAVVADKLIYQDLRKGYVSIGLLDMEVARLLKEEYSETQS